MTTAATMKAATTTAATTTAATTTAATNGSSRGRRPVRTCAKIERPDALVVAGGGAKAISALGAIHVLRRAGRLRDLKMVAGTSAGAIVAASVALGRSPLDICKALVAETYAPEFDIQNFTKNFGFDTGVQLSRWIDIVLDGTFTFDELRRRTGIDLVVCATNLNQRKPVYFCADKTPTTDVATAIRMSCAIPLFFSAVTLDDEVYVDGGLCDNFPYDWVANRPGIRRPLGLMYRYDKQTGPVKTLDAYISAIVQSATNQQYVREDATIFEIDCGDVGVLDFKYPEVLKRMFKRGALQTVDWIKKNV